jgi:hypothetical protein
MAVTVNVFRQDFPEFADDGSYPDSAVIFYLTLAGKLLNEARWGDVLDMGTELFIAHNLVLERNAQKTAAAGGVPGQNSGPLASKAVGPVNASYDTSAGIEEGAGHWNLTIYGTRFISLVRMFGAGPIQVT